MKTELYTGLFIYLKNILHPSWFPTTELFCYEEEQVGCFRNINVSVWRCQCAFPVHLKDVSHPGEVSRQSCSYPPCPLIVSQNCWSFEKCSQTSLLFGSAENNWGWTHTAQALSSVRGGNPEQLWAGNIHHTKSPGQDRTSRPELPPCPWGQTLHLKLATAAYSYSSALPSNSLIPFSFFLCQRKQKLLFRNKAAKENLSREGR